MGQTERCKCQLIGLHVWFSDKVFFTSIQLAYHGERGSVAPYRLRNCTGYRLHVWNGGNNTKPGETVVKTLEDGEEMPWWFEDWRERREVSIHWSLWKYPLIDLKTHQCHRLPSLATICSVSSLTEHSGKLYGMCP